MNTFSDKYIDLLFDYNPEVFFYNHDTYAATPCSTDDIGYKNTMIMSREIASNRNKGITGFTTTQKSPNAIDILLATILLLPIMPEKVARDQIDTYIKEKRYGEPLMVHEGNQNMIVSAFSKRTLEEHRSKPIRLEFYLPTEPEGKDWLPIATWHQDSAFSFGNIIYRISKFNLLCLTGKLNGSPYDIRRYLDEMGKG